MVRTITVNGTKMTRAKYKARCAGLLASGRWMRENILKGRAATQVYRAMLSVECPHCKVDEGTPCEGAGLEPELFHFARKLFADSFGTFER